MHDPLLTNEEKQSEPALQHERQTSVPGLLHDILKAFKGKNHEEHDDDKVPHPPAVEVLLSEGAPLESFHTEVVQLQHGLKMLKGIIPPGDVSHVAGVERSSDLVPGKYEGGLKVWECAIDLIEALRREMQDGHLLFRKKVVLELGCGHGLPGILACLKGATRVDFQDFNREVLTRLTIPNVEANMESAAAHSFAYNTDAADALPSPGRTALGRLPPPSPGAHPLASPRSCPLETHFFAGDWEDMPRLLSLAPPRLGPVLAADQSDLTIALGGEGKRSSGHEAGVLGSSDATRGNGLQQKQRSSLKKENLKVSRSAPEAARSNDVMASQSTSAGGSAGPKRMTLDINLVQGDSVGGEGSGQPSTVLLSPAASVAYHKELMGTPSFSTRTSEARVDEGGGYDVILMAETVYNPNSLNKLLDLLKQCLRHPYGVIYLAGKKHYFGVGGGTRQFKALVEQDGHLHSHLVAEFADGSSNIREIWKFFYR
eukprot:TRINITY_DN4332_c0_g1_i1.p1 TRINITY_DN4332_c0_g1~~TRINITY_DN4332_c0_g1_i1.p1  ORF type:complete len:485 (-),score=95.49 TRINITY_DN4332_c0_g1_i1:388-1842(-)